TGERDHRGVVGAPAQRRGYELVATVLAKSLQEASDRLVRRHPPGRHQPPARPPIPVELPHRIAGAILHDIADRRLEAGAEISFVLLGRRAKPLDLARACGLEAGEREVA